jgi:hypothetical protein
LASLTSENTLEVNTARDAWASEAAMCEAGGDESNGCVVLGDDEQWKVRSLL